ncbi:uncharacterized protein LOC110985412 [Acanthaster planci]|uniref:Uncharacterized protein LOC110985412 n=1 Tax=Acanthaster planci TaxID=133434 RepID=A0A8B7ZAW3_ACAPL|nr:uncharacterized protein LOC110985412 [Acanthaster planci]
MEKKAKHFVRLLARELYENEQTRVTGPVNIAAVKHAFRNALNDLPKSALKTELQRNAATYSRRLEALTKSARDDSSKSSRKGTNIEENEPKKQQESNNANTDDLRSSETKEKEACCQSKKTSDQKGLTKSTSEAVFSSFTHTEDRGNEERINDTVAMATPSEDKTEVADLEQGEASDSGSWSFAYNVYATDARSRVIESLAKLHSEKRQRLAPHAYASLCSTNSYFEFLQIPAM